MLHFTTFLSILVSSLFFPFTLAQTGVSLSLNVEGIGKIVVDPLDEPATMVTKFARAASAAGIAMTTNGMAQMLQYFCLKRTCTQNLPKTVTLTTATGSILTCEPWDEPASLIELFALESLKTGIQLTEADLTPLLSKLCSVTLCLQTSYRLPENPYTLNIEGVGQMVVGSYQDPADIVEKFAQQVADSELNVDIGFEQMKAMMLKICAVRNCKRTTLNPPSKTPLELTIEGVGKMICTDDQDPADVVDAFAAQATAAGFPITFENMKAMMEYFCNKRSCVRMELTVPTPVATKEETTAPPIVLTIDGIGKMACRSDQEPADVVEEFVKQAMAAKFDITESQMIQMLEYFCTRRECTRMQLTAPQ